jgi:hypothetical protein
VLFLVFFVFFGYFYGTVHRNADQFVLPAKLIELFRKSLFYFLPALRNGLDAVKCPNCKTKFKIAIKSKHLNEIENSMQWPHWILLLGQADHILST